MENEISKSYGNLAKRVRQKNNWFKTLFCCDEVATRASVARNIGYSDKQLERVPNDANLGVGCGNPSDHLLIRQGDVVLDLGSGAGIDAFIVAEKVGGSGKVIGIDSSHEMIALAERNAAKGNFEHVDFLLGRIEELPLPENSVDRIISNCVVNLSDQKDLVYKEAYRVLRSGGAMAISDVILKHELPAHISTSLAGKVACLSGAVSQEAYFAQVRNAGFKNIRIVSEKPFPLELMMMDPQIQNAAKELNIAWDSREAKQLAEHVVSITFVAEKE